MQKILRNHLALRSFLLLALLAGAVSSAWADEVTDVLNRDFTGIAREIYAEWSGEAEASGATYAGLSAGGKESIQLRSKSNNSGVVVTSPAENGQVTKLTFTWNENTLSGRTLLVYGSDQAYTAATDLYSDAKQGTLLAEVSIDDAVDGVSTLELSADASYPYIGFRSKDGAIWLSEVAVTWNVDSDAPVLSSPELSFAATGFVLTVGDAFEAPALVNPHSLPVVYSSDNTEVATVDALSGEVNILSAGEATITAAFEGNDSYRSGSARYTLTVKAPAQALPDIASLNALAESAKTDYVVTFDNVVVTYVNGSQAYLQDATAAVLLYKSNHGLQAGQVLNGRAYVTLTVYNGAPELTALDGVTVTQGSGDPVPAELTLAELQANFSQNINRYVVLRGLTAIVLNDSTFLQAGNDVIFPYKSGNPKNFTEGHTYDIVGFPSLYLGARQLTYTSFTDTTPADERPQLTLAFTVDGEAVSELALQVGDVLPGIATSTNAAELGLTNVPDVRISIAPQGIVSFNEAGDALTALAAGTAVITADVADGTSYLGTSAELTVVVSEAAAEQGETETIDFSALGFDNAQTLTTVEGDSVVLTFDKGNGTNEPKYYNNGTSARLYVGNTLSVSGDKVITKIEFTFDGNNTNLSLADDQPGTYANNVWEGEATDLLFTVGTGQARIQKMVITYGEGEVAPRLNIVLRQEDGSEVSTIDLQENGQAEVVATAYIDGQEVAVNYDLEISDEDIVSAETTSDADHFTLTGLKKGTATVRFSVPDGETPDAQSYRGASALLTVNVLSSTLDTQLAFDTEAVSLYVGEEQEVQLSTNRSSLDGLSVVSSNPDVLEVNYTDNGATLILIANAPGQATVTASLPETDNATGAEATLRVTVQVVEQPIAGYVFSKVTSLGNVSADDSFLIVYEDLKGQSYALNGTLDRIDVANDGIAVEVDTTRYTANAIAATTTLKSAAFTLTEATTDDGSIVYDIRSIGGLSIGNNASSNQLSSTADGALYNTVEFDEEGHAVITGMGGYTLQFNSASNQLRFRYYRSNSQKPVALYRLVEEQTVGIGQTRDIRQAAGTYDLTGRRTVAGRPGIYITGGKKVVVK